MQGSFEKDVQKKMDELKLSPSDAVWEKVELEIAPKKKKRRALLWFLSAALLLGGWWSYRLVSGEGEKEKYAAEKPGTSESIHSSAKENSSTAKSNTVEKPGTKREFENKNGENKVVSISPTVTTDAKEADKKTSAPAMTSSNGADVPFSKAQKTAAVKHSLQKHRQLTGRSSSAFDKERRRMDRPDGVSNRKPESEEKPRPSLLALETFLLPRQAEISGLISPGSLKERFSTAAKSDSATASADSAMKKKLAVKKWHREIGFGVGQSNYVTGFSINRFKAAEPVSYNTGGGGGSFVGPSTSPSYKPAATVGGVSFQAGYLFCKPLSSRFELALGLCYAYYSSHTKVGEKTTGDTTVSLNGDVVRANAYYTNTQAQDYTNTFHWLEAPVRLSYTPSQMPIVFSAGLAYGYLLATNALTFSGGSNIYYQNKRDYLRSSLPFSVSAQVELFGKKRMALRMGPMVQYNLMKLRREETTDVPHLFFMGIKTAVAF